MAGRTRGRRRRYALVPFALLSLLVSLLAPTAGAGVPSCMGEPATRIGTGGADVLRGTAGDDVFLGRGGGDRLIGRGGNDLFCGGPGDDVEKGGGGDDVLAGQGGADTLLGGPGNDTLLGGGGDDDLDGGDGTDELTGGAGTDECTQGETLASCEGPATELDVDGSWSGLTSQSKGISFDVAAHALTEITISYAWSGPSCTSESTTTILFTTPHAIVNNEFDIDSTSAGTTLQIHGTFTSTKAATGTFSASDPTDDFCPGSASGTWDAAKV